MSYAQHCTHHIHADMHRQCSRPTIDVRSSCMHGLAISYLYCVLNTQQFQMSVVNDITTQHCTHHIHAHVHWRCSRRVIDVCSSCMNGLAKRYNAISHLCASTKHSSCRCQSYSLIEAHNSRADM